ncbi:macrophage mannose receptor 1-like [Mercenaria mercenaria]|uniref:macrophage mannose receptor 1-like n=1 Tax=Mercenaria mercenaria TaxID=6596 RepID=UPI00234EAA66|nr:macrophage mannose receptor 1-like [Mercenaria mercenaria]
MDFQNIITFALIVAMCSLPAHGALRLEKRQATESMCPQGWSFFSRDCYVYKYDSDRKNWVDAEADCVTNGGHLVDINSEAEKTFLVNVMENTTEYSPRPAWIGLNDRTEANTHVWVSSNKVPTYTNWGVDEPNDVSDTQPCVQMYSSGLWNDMRCSYSRNYFCKRPANEECQDGWSLYNRRCYKYSDITKNWNASQNTCIGDGGGLVEITSAEVNIFLVNLRSGSTVADAWIGLNKVGDTHKWMPSGNVASYTNWAPGEPNNHESSENCIEMYQDGKWNDHNCANTRRYFCEKLPNIIPYE